MKWFQQNFKTIIYVAFLVPILTVAFVSISHVSKWYGLSNPVSWAIYLSIGIEIAALSALAAISARMGKKVYFPFGIVTLIQFIGNIFFAYQYIDINSQSFKDWVDMVSPLVNLLGVDANDMVGHKRFLALFSGGMLPIISLSFLHMLIKFEEEDKKIVEYGEKPKLETPVSNEELVKEPSKAPQNASEMMITTNEEIISLIPSDDEVSEMDLNDENIDIVEVIDTTEKIVPITEEIVPVSEEPKINRLSYSRRDG
jgi:hypothetical protein